MADSNSTQPTLFDSSEQTKRCPRCGIVKPLTREHFQYYIRGRTGNVERMSHCKACQLIAKRASISKNPGKHRQKRYRLELRKKYGMTQEDYDVKFKEQGGLCAICQQPETMRRRGGSLSPLSVDHNHRTEEIRDLLCSRCNHMIGMAKENPEVLRIAADYIEHHADLEELYFIATC